MELQELLRKSAEAYREELVAIRRYLHTHPGTGFDLADTVAFVKERLVELGYQPQDCGRAGVVALAGGKREGKVFLLRADMDALPIPEEADVEFPSTNGNMHACGHDLHTTMLLGAAKLLKEYEERIDGTVKLMFQPAEEPMQGAKDMIEAGALQNPAVDAGIMIHVVPGMMLEPGTVIIPSVGVSASASDVFEIRVEGAGCHGSSPHTGVDPISAAAHILLALQEINAREVAHSEQVILTVGSFHGGSAPNAIPDTAVLSGTIRTYDDDLRVYIKDRLCEIATGVASAFRAKAEVTFLSGCPTVVNDGPLAADAARYAAELLGEDKTITPAKIAAWAQKPSRRSISAGSEDFAYVTREIPALMINMAAGRPDQGCRYPLHNPKARFDEAVLPRGSAFYAYAAMRWLEEQS